MLVGCVSGLLLFVIISGHWSFVTPAFSSLWILFNYFAWLMGFNYFLLFLFDCFVIVELLINS
jgi:hypothetical protein